MLLITRKTEFLAMYDAKNHGYIVAKAAIIGHTISVDRIIVYLAMITIVAHLFYASGTLKIEV